MGKGRWVEGVEWDGVVVGPLAANCSGQANEKQDMSECRACINIALKDLKAGSEKGPPKAPFVRLMSLGNNEYALK